MEYIEFSKYKKISDPKTVVNGYEDEEGNIFYVEPAFYYNLQGFKDKEDISDPLGLFFEDKSRGSDYGD